jgi:hypothetical protein
VAKETGKTTTSSYIPGISRRVAQRVLAMRTLADGALDTSREKINETSKAALITVGRARLWMDGEVMLHFILNNLSTPDPANDLLFKIHEPWNSRRAWLLETPLPPLRDGGATWKFLKMSANL